MKYYCRQARGLSPSALACLSLFLSWPLKKLGTKFGLCSSPPCVYSSIPQVGGLVERQSRRDRKGLPSERGKEKLSQRYWNDFPMFLAPFEKVLLCSQVRYSLLTIFFSLLREVSTVHVLWELAAGERGGGTLIILSLCLPFPSLSFSCSPSGLDRRT